MSSAKGGRDSELDVDYLGPNIGVTRELAFQCASGHQGDGLRKPGQGVQEFGRANADNQVTPLKHIRRCLTTLGSRNRLSSMGRLRLFVCAAVGCWAFVVMPSLCSGGVLLHPCECNHSEDADHEEKEGCKHESDCATDPCGDIVTRPDDECVATSDFNSAVTYSHSAPLLFDPCSVTPMVWPSPLSRFVGASVHDALSTIKLLI